MCLWTFVEELFSQKLNTVFVATDAPTGEFAELAAYLDGFNVIKYIPEDNELRKFRDGGVAIIDQIICSHAKLALQYICFFTSNAF